MTTETGPFRISAGLKNLIGRELVTDDFAAVFELVKNSFDAHATSVRLRFEPDRIVVADNGKGMSRKALRDAGVQQARRGDRIEFSSLTPWPGRSSLPRRASGATGSAAPGSSSARNPAPSPARTSWTRRGRPPRPGSMPRSPAPSPTTPTPPTLPKLGRIPILRARMNADQHMAEDLTTTGKGNLFVDFGEPAIEIEPARGAPAGDHLRVRLRGVEVFHPRTGEIRSDSLDAIACRFLDTAYDGEGFFVRHVCFPGAVNDPYKALKNTLKAEIDREARDSLRRDVSRPFPKPATGRIAVEAINHLGDEPMKAFRV